jgi:cytochrome c553
MSAPYLKAQLEHFQQDRRKSAVMAPMAKPLSAEEIEALAAYYASLPAPQAHDPSAPGADAALVSAGEALVRYGRWSQDIPACVACHGDALGGLGTAFPALTGQPAAYIKASLTQWKTGKRGGDPNDLMGSVARRMSEADIDAAAAYLATLPTTAKVKP